MSSSARRQAKKFSKKEKRDAKTLAAARQRFKAPPLAEHGPARIIAIANQKGGVGKTTTAVNLSAALVEQGRRVLLVDCDSQGNATSGVGVDKTAVAQTVYEVITGATPAADAVITTDCGVELIPANVELTGAEVEMAEQEVGQREYRLRQAIEPLRPVYDYIIIDCPPSLGLLSLNTLVAADGVLIPLQCEFYALEGLSLLKDTIELVKNELNPKLVIDGVLLTMYDSRTRLSLDVAQDARDNLTEPVYETMIPRSVRLSEAPSFGQPIMVYDGAGKGAEVYRKLALEVLQNGR